MYNPESYVTATTTAIAAMAEAIAAVNLVGALVQVTEFGYKLLKRLIEVHLRVTPEYAKPFREIENQVPLLLSVLERIRSKLDGHGLNEADELALKRTIDGCREQITRLNALLDLVFPLPDASRLQRMWKAVTNMRKERKFSLIQQALEYYKTTLTLHLALESRNGADRGICSLNQSALYHAPSVQVSRFVGRDIALADISQKLSRPLEPPVGPQIVVILGMGGLGKTQLVLEYCRRAFDSHRFNGIFWTDASRPVALANSFANLSEVLPSARNVFSDVETKIKSVKAILSRWSEPWLLIFDNFDRPALFRETPIQDYFPAGLNGAIVIISRHADVARLGPTIILDIMSEEECKSLLRRSGVELNSANDTQGRVIMQKLGYLPLAIDQAGAYIGGRKLDLGHFMDHYNRRRIEVLNHTPDLWEYRKWRDDTESESAISLFTTWEMSFQQIGLDESGKRNKTHFLTVSAFLNNQNVPEGLFRAMFESTRYPPDWMDIFSTDDQWDPYKFEDVLVELRNLSLLQSLDHNNQGSGKFSLHPLVQDWLKLRQSDFSRQRFTKEAMNMLTTYLDDSQIDRRPLDTRHDTLSHLDACVQNDLEYLHTGDNLGTGLFRLSATRFASYYKRQARYKESKTLWQRVLNAAENENGPRGPDTLEAVSKLGNLYSKEGKYPEAESSYTRALSGREQILGNDHPHTLESVLDLATVYFKQGHYEAAEPLFERSLIAYERTQGVSNLRTLWSAMNLGMVLKKQARYERANALYQRAMEGQEQLLGLDHPETLKTVMNLASARLDQGDFKTAESLAKQVIKGREKNLGPDHPNTLRSLWNLARVHSATGQFDMADSLFLRALAGQEEQLGPNHPFTMKTVKDLAHLRYRQNRLDDAERLYKRAIQGLRIGTGQDHPSTLSAMSGLANVYLHKGDLPLAQELFNDALAGQRKRLGFGHPESLRTRRDLGKLYTKQERFKYAEEMLVSAYEGLEKILGLTHTDTQDCLHNLDLVRQVGCLSTA